MPKIVFIYFAKNAENFIMKYTCNNTLILKDIKEILTNESYIKIETYMKINKTRIINNQSLDKNLGDMNNENNDINTNKRNSTTMEINNIINNESCKGIKKIKRNLIKIQIPKSKKKKKLINFALKQHMLKIDNLTRFKTKVKNEKEIKKIICLKCGKASLFSRDDQNFIRCLNCNNAICKYCFKQLESTNTLRALNAICGVCYSGIRFRKKHSYAKKFFYEILFVICGLLAVWIGFSKYEATFFFKNKKRKIYYLFLFVLLVFLALNSIVLILFIPFFPIFISLFG